MEQIKTPSGTYYMGTMPICSDERLAEKAPRLVELLEQEEGTGKAEYIEELAFEMVRFYNPGLKRDDFMVDVYSYERIQDVWNCRTYNQKKSLTHEHSADTPAQSAIPKD